MGIKEIVKDLLDIIIPIGWLICVYITAMILVGLTCRLSVALFQYGYSLI